MDKVDTAVLNETEDSEKQQQEADDNEKLAEVLSGRQEIFITGYGNIIFDMPNTGLALEGDKVAARFKTEHLRKSDFLTDAQLKAIYSKPTVIEIDGKEMVVGSGEWTEKNERDIETLPEKIQSNWTTFMDYRSAYQAIQQEILALSDLKKNKAKKKSLETKLHGLQNQALEQHQIVLGLKTELVRLQTVRVRLFSDSLEEQSFFEKVKLYAPSCIKIKKDGKEDFLWHSEEEMFSDKFTATRIISLFNLFVRGLDVSFFGDAPEGETSS